MNWPPDRPSLAKASSGNRIRSEGTITFALRWTTVHWRTDVPARTFVLVVEDEPLILLSTSNALEDEGFTVLQAASADAALVLLDQHPDIRMVLTDIEMPGKMDGLNLADRARERLPGALIVITSGRRLPPKGDLPSGARFMAKPYYLSDLTLIAKDVKRHLRR